MAPIQFVVDVDEAGHLRARAIDSDISIEAETMPGLERSVVEAVFKRAGGYRSLHLVKDAPRANQRTSWRLPSRR
ncbi:MAG TPA: hypothetical protein VGG33_12730 [Polyangia bacterium]